MRELNACEIKEVNGGFLLTLIKAAIKYAKSKQAKRNAAIVTGAQDIPSDQRQEPTP